MKSIKPQNNGEAFHKQIQTIVKRPEPGEVAVSFEEGGMFHVIPGAKIVVFGKKEQIIFDGILEEAGEHPWRAPMWRDEE